MGVVSGDMFVDGQHRDSSFQRKTGYVQQQDLHLETSTVREALVFSARLRQPKTFSDAEKLEYVEEVIRLLNMEKYADAVVGVPGEGSWSLSVCGVAQLNQCVLFQVLTSSSANVLRLVLNLLPNLLSSYSLTSRRLVLILRQPGPSAHCSESWLTMDKLFCALSISHLLFSSRNSTGMIRLCSFVKDDVLTRCF